MEDEHELVAGVAGMAVRDGLAGYLVVAMGSTKDHSKPFLSRWLGCFFQ